MAKKDEIVVVGAGVFGLATGYALARRGIAVRVLDRARPGAGASGGPVGALTPHMPERWTPFKAFQLAALLGLPEHLRGLGHAEESGINAVGYARPGRWSPLSRPADPARLARNIEAAETHWAGQGRWRWRAAVPEASTGWLAPERAIHGLVEDTLSARLWPSGYLAALAAAIARHGGSIETGAEVVGLQPDGGICLADGRRIVSGKTVIAAGAESFALLGIAARGVKGQAALLRADLPAPPGELPVLYGEGLYVVAHDTGLVGIGSTSERDWQGAGPDDQLETIIAAARVLCPALDAAEVVARWAGVRPRAPRRLPMVGPMPGAPHILAATGGYKIGFGIAHLVGEAVAALAQGEEPAVDLPAAFAPSAHLAGDERAVTARSWR